MMQDSNQKKVYAELEKWHMHYCSGSLEDKLNYLFSTCSTSCTVRKYLTCLTLYPCIVKGDQDYSRFPEGNMKRNGCLIHLNNQDSIQSKYQMCQGTRPFFG